ncbi:MAG: hypothetical protein ACXVMS_10150 [Flavisolibacter sp.]
MTNSIPYDDQPEVDKDGADRFQKRKITKPYLSMKDPEVMLMSILHFNLFHVHHQQSNTNVPEALINGSASTLWSGSGSIEAMRLVST